MTWESKVLIWNLLPIRMGSRQDSHEGQESSNVEAHARTHAPWLSPSSLALFPCALLRAYSCSVLRDHAPGGAPKTLSVLGKEPDLWHARQVPYPLHHHSTPEHLIQAHTVSLVPIVSVRITTIKLYSVQIESFQLPFPKSIRKM